MALQEQHVSFSTGGPFFKLFDVGGYGFSATGGTSLLNAHGTIWRWGHQRAGLFGPVTQSSREADNAGNNDYMVTYQITGLNDNWTIWMVFWEDTSSKHGDFNDVVVEVRATTDPSAQNPVPAPGACALATIGLGLVGGLRRRPRQRA